MSSIRSFEKEDIHDVVEMYQHLFMKENPSRRNLPIHNLTSHFEKVFFNHPWYDPEITSLVSEGKDGKINGFLGVVPREMSLCGRPIRAAVSFYHMADPDSRSSMAGIQLLKKFFSGPQDLCLTDGAGDSGRRVWLGVGGTQAPLYSFQWERIFRPARFAVEAISRSRIFSPFEGALSPAANLADLITSRFMPGNGLQTNESNIEEELDIKVMIESLPLFYQPDALLPVYREETLGWILDQAGQMRSHGDLKKVMVRNSSGEVIGWFLYYAKPGRRCPVLHVAAKKGSMNVVLNHLFNHARRYGVTALFGWINPRYIQEIANQHCYFRIGAGTLIYSRNEKLIDIFKRGDAAVSRLDGEWYMHF